MIKSIRILILIYVSVFSGISSAHDPGLSYVELRIIQHRLEAHLVFARYDLESLVGINTEKDGKISTNPDLEYLAKQALKITQGGQDLQVANTSLSIAENDAVNIGLNISLLNNEAITIRSELLPGLARGHRQYLSIIDSQNRLIGETILSAESREFKLHYNQQSDSKTFIKFLQEGVHHIWIGIDHILFLVTLLLPAVLVLIQDKWYTVTAFKKVFISTLKVVTAFTIAHSITLSLAVLGIVYIPSRFVESVIALSVILAALNNLYPCFTEKRWLLAFVFGLIHGFGFAGVLTELGLPDDRLITSLLGFNLGVEAGQIAIVMLLLPVLFLIREANYYRTFVLKGGSIAALLMATIWLLDRSMNVQVFEIIGIT